MNSSTSQLLKPDVTLSLGPSSPTQDLKPEERGIKLIQLLITCANHASSRNLHHADACLQQISHLATITGDPIQRLATRFASALAVRLIKRWPGLYKAMKQTQYSIFDLDQARSMFAQTFPYLGFAYAVMNRVLIQAMSGECLLHIVDLGSGDPKLWIPFLRTLAVRLPHGQEQRSPGLKITCVHTNMGVLEKLRNKLSKEAESLDIPFQFNPLQVSLRDLKLDMLKVRPEEALAFTSVLNLHVLLAEDDRINAHFGFIKNDGIKDNKRMTEFLAMLRSLSPKVVLLLEQESDHNTIRLADRFIEGLHYYSALFDSISTSFGGSSCEERLAIEEMFGKEIENIVACEGLEREERHEPYAKWTIRFGKAGFMPIRLWYDTMEDAKRLLEAFGMDGYKVTSQSGSLMIYWHERPIYTVSAWNCFR